jgi:hypothetical protein
MFLGICLNLDAYSMRMYSLNMCSYKNAVVTQITIVYLFSAFLMSLSHVKRRKLCSFELTIFDWYTTKNEK